MTKLITDVFMWVFLVVTTAILEKYGVVEDGPLALAAGTLWIALRARSKAATLSQHQEGGGE